MPQRQSQCTLIALVVSLSACVTESGGEPPAGWADFDQKLELDRDGTSVPVPLEGMDLWLTEDDAWPETFEIKGTGISLGGALPGDVRVGYEDNWRALLGRTIAIAAQHATPYEDKSSVVTVPGVGPVEVLGGHFTIDEVGEDRDAQTPISGQIELRLRTGSGAVTIRGRLAVKGTGWG